MMPTLVAQFVLCVKATHMLTSVHSAMLVKNTTVRFMALHCIQGGRISTHIASVGVVSLPDMTVPGLTLTCHNTFESVTALLAFCLTESSWKNCGHNRNTAPALCGL